MELSVIRSVDVPAGQGAACVVRRGERLRVVDVQGGQVADFNVWMLDDPRERFWSARTRIMERSHLTTGHRLWSSPNMVVLFTITADTVIPKDSPLGGRSHDLLWARCSSRLWELRDGLPNMPNCQDNLARAIEPHGLSVHDVHDAFNIFMKTGLDANDRLFYFGALGSIGVVPRTPRMSSSTLLPARSCASPRGGATTYSPTGRPEAVNPHGSDSAGQHTSVIA